MPDRHLQVQRVCERAMKEFAIEKALDDMAASWADVMLEVISYRATGTYVIKVSEIWSLCEFVDRWSMRSLAVRRAPPSIYGRCPTR